MDDIISKITDSELEILKILWQESSEIPISDLIKKLEDKWEASTIKTLIRRLCNKGAVLATKKDLFYYKPLVSETEYNDFITKKLIDRLYSGSAKNLVANLLDNKKLNDSDIKELRDLFKVGDKNE